MEPNENPTVKKQVKVKLPHLSTITDLRFVDDDGNIYQLDHHGIRGNYTLRKVEK